MRLEFCLIPRSTAGMNARTMCSKKQWNRARYGCYRRAGYGCEICDDVGPDHPVECHEQWEWLTETRIQQLVQLIALCPTCHQAVHMGHSLGSMDNVYAVGERYIELLQHMAKVNDVSMDKVRECLKYHREQYIHRLSVKWRVNVDLVKHFEEQLCNIIFGGFKL